MHLNNKGIFTAEAFVCMAITVIMAALVSIVVNSAYRQHLLNLEIFEKAEYELRMHMHIVQDPGKEWETDTALQ